MSKCSLKKNLLYPRPKHSLCQRSLLLLSVQSPSGQPELSICISRRVQGFTHWKAPAGGDQNMAPTQPAPWSFWSSAESYWFQLPWRQHIKCQLLRSNVALIDKNIVMYGNITLIEPLVPIATGTTTILPPLSGASRHQFEQPDVEGRRFLKYWIDITWASVLGLAEGRLSTRIGHRNTQRG